MHASDSLCMHGLRPSQGGQGEAAWANYDLVASRKAALKGSARSLKADLVCLEAQEQNALGAMAMLDTLIQRGCCSSDHSSQKHVTPPNLEVLLQVRIISGACDFWHDESASSFKLFLGSQCLVYDDSLLMNYYRASLSLGQCSQGTEWEGEIIVGTLLLGC